MPYFSDVDANVLGPAAVQRGAVSADVDDGRVFAVVDEHLPAVVAPVRLHLRLVQLQVQIVEHSRHADVRIV